MSISGVADLPLHEGRVPEYLLKRMKTLGSIIARLIVDIYGESALLERLADPLWFQAFNNIIGMDWDSSGSTTVVLYVLKNAFKPSEAKDRGIAVLGGKGRDALMILQEVKSLGGRFNLEGIVETSRLAARIDSIGIQDGYALYIQGLITTTSEEFLVIQQGMNISERVARRYHIHLRNLEMVDCEKDPHSGVLSSKIRSSLNMVDDSSRPVRAALMEIVESTPVSSLISDIHEVNRLIKGLPKITSFLRTTTDMIEIQSHGLPVKEKIHRCPIYYRPIIDVKRVATIAEEIKKQCPASFKELMMMEGIGPESLRAFVLVADLIYGYEPSLRDPTTHIFDPFLYSYAHGGKDGIPYKIRAKEVDRTINFFSTFLSELKVARHEKEFLLKNLAKFARRVKSAYYPVR
ncbi:MAG: DUF763 domain-containing protein [Desulfurococcaceae archaeon]